LKTEQVGSIPTNYSSLILERFRTDIIYHKEANSKSPLGGRNIAITHKQEWLPIFNNNLNFKYYEEKQFLVGF
jgi:hypothetical protein